MPPCAAGFSAQLKWSRATNCGRLVTDKPRQPAKCSLNNGYARLGKQPDEDLHIIEQLLSLALAAVARKAPDVRLGDILKLLEFKQRLQPQVDAREVFWEWIERFRREAGEKRPGRISDDDDSADSS